MMVELTRDFCLPCQQMRPTVEALRNRHEGAIDIVEVNVDRAVHRPYAILFGVRTVPAQVFVDATGRVVARDEGFATETEIRDRFRELGWLP